MTMQFRKQGTVICKVAPALSGTERPKKSCCCACGTCVQLLQVLNNMQGHKQHVAAFAKRWAQAAKQRAVAPSQQILTTGNCVRDPETHKYVVAPAVDGRIRLIDAAAEAAEAAVAAVGGDAAAVASTVAAAQ